MDIPDLVAQRLGSEQARAVVPLEDDDLAVFTPTRTLLYRAESLLRDATVESYDHDVEGLSVAVGRRNATFTMEYVGGTEQFTVPNANRTAVLEQVLRGALDVAGVLGESERVRAVYRFSDLTVVITDGRLVKHVGAATWDSDYEEFRFGSVTGLEFEEGDVATQVVLWVDGRAERIKTPTDEAPVLRQTLIRALLEYHDADSLERLNERLAPDDEATPHASLSLDDDIAPLIESSESEPSVDVDPGPSVASFEFGSDTAGVPDDDPGAGSGGVSAAGDQLGSSTATTDEPTLEQLEQQLSELRQVVERQTELLERQSRHISELTRQLDESDRR